MQGMKISLSKVGAKQDISLITISGYVDTTTCKELARTIQDTVEQRQYLIICDLAGVSYVSSAGWGVFMGEIKNIRDKGGDLKVVQMNPEVFEVFEMLEFTRILNYYDTLEEAIDEFDIIRGLDITASRSPVQAETVSGDARNQGVPEGTVPVQVHHNLQSFSLDSEPDELPLAEKVKKIVLENPLGGARNIQKRLLIEKYGTSKVSWFKIRSVLKELNLDTKNKRYRYYRSR